MATRGKNIQLFLMDGDASGRIKCTMANWTGIAYKIPRTHLIDCKDRADLKQSGVYFMFGTSGDDEHSTYVGQAGLAKMAKDFSKELKSPMTALTGQK